jgi:hypothetical protein
MIILTLAVFSLFNNNGVKLPSNPPNRTLLLRNSEPLIEVEGMRKDFLRLFEPDSTSGVGPQPFALSMMV